MSYEHALTQEIVARAASLAALADIGNWAPGFFPVKIRAIALMIGNDVGGAGVVKVDKRPTFGSDTSRGDGDVAILNLATTHLGGNVVYKDGLDVTIKPGEQIVFEVTDLTLAGDIADLLVVYEPVWEQPANVTAMKKTT